MERAIEIVGSYDTLVTLRQLFYRLVSEQVLPNRQSYYKRLSERTAEGRRQGWFPTLLDRTSRVYQDPTFTSPTQALTELAAWYRLDRADGQPLSLYLAVEKAGLVEQLRGWFGDLGVPIIALGGYASQSLVDRIRLAVEQGGRPARLLYAGDFDASGEDIYRDFQFRTGCWERAVTVALSRDQVHEYGLPENPGKETDPRTRAFKARHGVSVQVELDALDPNTLRDLYRNEIDKVWDQAAYERVLEVERDHREHLTALANRPDS